MLKIPQFYRITLSKFKKKKSTKRTTALQFEWIVECEKAFSATKQALAAKTLLNHFDPCAELSIYTDASLIALGAVIPQRKKDMWEPLCFFSRKLTSAQQKYSSLTGNFLRFIAQ